MRRSNATCAALVLAILVAGAPAAAQQPSGAPVTPQVQPAQSASDRADELVRQGNELGRKDRWKEAEPLFREAWSLKRSYDISGNLGLAEAALGKWREAAGHLRFALDGFPANGKPQHRKLLEITFAKVRAEVGAVAITVNVKGAEILVDGAEVGAAPLAGEVFVDPGVRIVEARLAGYKAASAAAAVGKGGREEVRLTLMLAGAEGQGGGAPIGKPPVEQPPVIEAPRPPLWPIAVGAGAAILGLGVGVGLTVAANGKSSDAAVLQKELGSSYACVATAPSAVGACAELLEARQALDGLSNGAVAAFAISGVLALGTAGYAVWALSRPRPAPAPVVKVMPSAGPQGGGVRIVGAW